MKIFETISMKLLFLIVIAALIILFEFTLSGKIAIFNVRPNLVLIFLVLIASTATEAKQKSERKFLPVRRSYMGEAGAKWQFFLITAVCGLLFDILSIEYKNGIFLIAFLLTGALICFLLCGIPFKHLLFKLAAIIVISTFIFNLALSRNISYSFSQNQFVEIIYNAALLILIFGIINFRKFFKILRV